MHSAVGQQYSPLGFQGQPLPSQLAAFNAAAAATVVTTNEARKAQIFCQMDALRPEHHSLK